MTASVMRSAGGTNGVSFFFVVTGAVVGGLVGPAETDGVPVGDGTGTSVADGEGVSDGIDGSITSVGSGDDVATGPGATPISEHEVSATETAALSTTSPPARSSDGITMCSPTRPG